MGYSSGAPTTRAGSRPAILCLHYGNASNSTEFSASLRALRPRPCSVPIWSASRVLPSSCLASCLASRADKRLPICSTASPACRPCTSLALLIPSSCLRDHMRSPRSLAGLPCMSIRRGTWCHRMRRRAVPSAASLTGWDWPAKVDDCFSVTVKMWLSD